MPPGDVVAIETKDGGDLVALRWTRRPAAFDDRLHALFIESGAVSEQLHVNRVLGTSSSTVFVSICYAASGLKTRHFPAFTIAPAHVLIRVLVVRHLQFRGVPFERRFHETRRQAAEQYGLRQVARKVERRGSLTVAADGFDELQIVILIGLSNNFVVAEFFFWQQNRARNALIKVRRIKHPVRTDVERSLAARKFAKAIARRRAAGRRRRTRSSSSDRR